MKTRNIAVVFDCLLGGGQARRDNDKYAISELSRREI